MIRLIAAILLGLSFQLSAMAHPHPEPNGGGQVLPWPWGTECPFPWQDFEGLWLPELDDEVVQTSTFFKFEVVDQWTSGTRVFQVTHYGFDGSVLAVGKGTAAKGYRVVRAVLLPTQYHSMSESYSVIVRAYTEDRFTCSDKLITVLTMRKRGAPPAEDVHMVINRAVGPDQD